MAYGSLALDEIATSGNLAIAGNVITSGNLTVTGSLKAPNSVIGIYQVVKTDTFISASTSWVNVTGLSLTITPQSSSSRFLLISDLAMGPNSGAGSYSQRFARDGSAITGYIGDAAGNRQRAMVAAYGGDTAGAATIINATKLYVDSPATASSITYTIQLAGSTTSPGYVNRAQRDENLSTYDPRMASSFTILEIGG